MHGHCTLGDNLRHSGLLLINVTEQFFIGDSFDIPFPWYLLVFTGTVGIPTLYLLVLTTNFSSLVLLVTVLSGRVVLLASFVVDSTVSKPYVQTPSRTTYHSTVVCRHHHLHCPLGVAFHREV